MSTIKMTKKIPKYKHHLIKSKFYQTLLRGDNKNGNKKISFISFLSLLISFLSLFIAYKSLNISLTEKGAKIEPKVVSSLSQPLKNKDIVVSIQNTSNTKIGVNSAYLLEYEIDSEQTIHYNGIVKNKRISFTKLEPFEKQFDTIVNYIGDNALAIVSEKKSKEIILEFRVYFSRLYDGKVYGIRSFYTVDGLSDMYDYNLFTNENELRNSIKFLNKNPSLLENSSEYSKQSKYNERKLKFIEKLKSNAFVRDSLNTQSAREEYPSLYQPYLTENAQYDIKLTSQQIKP